ncbi:GerMN domain-containing protein [Carboxydothermus ferrireducens]|uniref:Spore germination protein GerM n=1 Tax=Carboxydothermus ferrireducens DSM 11255 TaxID=1119529 RepID=A0ABX2R8P6_9THEO|nr:GerMN domain-containing protein [Carboxydothermus ferrireducens]NYE57294.1 spore germination protein GerM [Carboxydothermus ferrireducens DSM 11255]
MFRKIMAGTLVVFLLAGVAGCSWWNKIFERKAVVPDKTEVKEKSVEVGQKGEMVEVVLYFADETGEYLVPEKRMIAKVPSIARETLNELFAGPQSSNLKPVVPSGTVLRDINVKPDGLCIVDLSREVIDNHPGGSAAEALTVYAIVDTLCQFPTIKKVEFRVEGEKVESLKGHMDLTVPVEKNGAMIKIQN